MCRGNEHFPIHRKENPHTHKREDMEVKDVLASFQEKCRGDIEFFIDTFGHIEDKDADELIQPFQMWDEQRRAVKSIMENRKNIILKARQLGITWLALHVAAWYVTLHTGRTVIALSRSESEAKELVRRLGVILRNMPLIYDSVQVQTGWSGPVFKQTAMSIEITWPDGPPCIFQAFPSSPSAGRSFTADLIILDEWAFQQWAEEIWKAIYPVINRPTGGKIIGLSTIERGSLFEELFTNQDNGFNKIFIPWYADPRRTEEWYDETKRSMGDDITQEYPATIEEALKVPGGSYFPEVNYQNTISKEKMDGIVRRYVAFDYGFDMFACLWISVDRNGEAQVYRAYGAPDKTIRAACDIIKDLSQGEEIYQYLAPSDLWSRDQVTGISRALHFSNNGIPLTKTSRDFPNGCAGMKAWLEPRKDAEGNPKKSRLTILDGAAPELYRCLSKIQKDKNRPNVYAKDPHDLTHMCLTGDMLVATTKGFKRMDEMTGGEKVYCADKKGRIRKSRVTDACMTRPLADVYEIELEDGTKVKATLDHKFMTKDGFKTVSDLHEGDCIVQACFGESFHPDIQDCKSLFCNTSLLKKVCHRLRRFFLPCD